MMDIEAGVQHHHKHHHHHHHNHQSAPAATKVSFHSRDVSASHPKAAAMTLPVAATSTTTAMLSPTASSSTTESSSAGTWSLSSLNSSSNHSCKSDGDSSYDVPHSNSKHSINDSKTNPSNNNPENHGCHDGSVSRRHLYHPPKSQTATTTGVVPDVTEALLESDGFGESSSSLNSANATVVASGNLSKPEHRRQNSLSLSPTTAPHLLLTCPLPCGATIPDAPGSASKEFHSKKQQQQQQQNKKNNQKSLVKHNGGGFDRAPRSGKLPLTNIVANLNNQAHQQQTMKLEPQLLHPMLSKVPIQFRFGFTGLFSNILFMMVYNWAVDTFSSPNGFSVYLPQKTSTTTQQNVIILQPTVIYGCLYFLFIPASHFLLSLFVFGWPERYWTSLCSNFPIGLTALAIGCLLTAYLDQTSFNDIVAQFVQQYCAIDSLSSSYFTASISSSLSSSLATVGYGSLPPAPAEPPRQEPPMSIQQGRRRVFIDGEESMAPNGDPGVSSSTGEFYSSMVVLVVTSLWTYVLSVYVNGPPTKSQKKD